MNAVVGNGRLGALAILLAVVGAVFDGGVAWAQTANFPPGGAKLPQWSEMADWDSVWERGNDLFAWDDRLPVGVPQTPPYNEQYQNLVAQQARPQPRLARPGEPVAAAAAGANAAGGGAAGGRGAMPGFMILLRPMEIQVNPHEVLIIIEGGAARRIYTDGRLPPTDPIPTAAGYSTGHWKNRELIVDTCCFAESTRLPGGGLHSDAMHITERFHSPKGGMLVDEISVEDPKAFTKPWTTVKTFYRRPDWELLPPELTAAGGGAAGGGGPNGAPGAVAPAAAGP
jgi:hypothetical protein